MGYYTEYSLTSKGDDMPGKVERIQEELARRELIGYALDNFWDCTDNTAIWPSAGAVNWHDPEQELAEFSKKFPDVAFMLSAVGEDPDDQWHLYFQNGQYEFCYGTMIFPEPVIIKWPKDA